MDLMKQKQAGIVIANSALHEIKKEYATSIVDVHTVQEHISEVQDHMCFRLSSSRMHHYVRYMISAE